MILNFVKAAWLYSKVSVKQHNFSIEKRKFWEITFGAVVLVDSASSINSRLNSKKEQEDNGGAYPPDLSLITKARHDGQNYAFALLTGYRDPPAGVSRHCVLEMAATRFLLCYKPHLLHSPKVGTFNVSCHSVNLSNPSVLPTGSAERPWKVADARLVLEDGSIWRAKSFGASGTQVGEIVFNTSLTGYQEILTDPSYAGQFVLMTNPHIGNTGANTGVKFDDEESKKCFIGGLIIRSLAPQTGDALKHLEIIWHPGTLWQYMMLTLVQLPVY